jgi:hypothetical protein
MFTVVDLLIGLGIGRTQLQDWKSPGSVASIEPTCALGQRFDCTKKA